MQTVILDTREKKMIAGREAVEFSQSLAGRVLFQNLAISERASVAALTGLTPTDKPDVDYGRALAAAATAQMCNRIREWFKQLEHEGTKAQNERD